MQTPSFASRELEIFSQDRFEDPVFAQSNASTAVPTYSATAYVNLYFNTHNCAVM